MGTSTFRIVNNFNKGVIYTAYINTYSLFPMVHSDTLQIGDTTLLYQYIASPPPRPSEYIELLKITEIDTTVLLTYQTPADDSKWTVRNIDGNDYDWIYLVR